MFVSSSLSMRDRELLCFRVVDERSRGALQSDLEECCFRDFGLVVDLECPFSFLSPAKSELLELCHLVFGLDDLRSVSSPTSDLVDSCFLVFSLNDFLMWWSSTSGPDELGLCGFVLDDVASLASSNTE
jgi:hypothetical protein